jgi:hypothetical protein
MVDDGLLRFADVTGVDLIACAGCAYYAVCRE